MEKDFEGLKLNTQKVWEPFTVLDLIISRNNMPQEEEEYEIKDFCETAMTRSLAALIFFPWEIILLRVLMTSG